MGRRAQHGYDLEMVRRYAHLAANHLGPCAERLGVVRAPGRLPTAHKSATGLKNEGPSRS
jgi:hypothetical protein